MVKQLDKVEPFLLNLNRRTREVVQLDLQGSINSRHLLNLVPRSRKLLQNSNKILGGVNNARFSWRFLLMKLNF